VGNNKTLAARVLGLDRKTLYRKLRQYEADSGDTDTNPMPPGVDETQNDDDP